MGLVVMQLNIQNWSTNRYAFMIDISNYNPDIISLNETSAINNYIKLRGYYTTQSCTGRFTGVAILIKLGLHFTIIPTNNEDTLAIKVSMYFS